MEIKLSRTEMQSFSIQTRKRQTGRIRWYNSALCYGFLRAENGNDTDIFFHKSSLQVPGIRTIRNGQRVLFEECGTSKGIIGLNVIPIAEDTAELLNAKLKGIMPK